MSIEVKKDPYLWAFAGVLVVATMVLVGFDKVTFKEAGAFVLGALALPALFGRKNDDGDPPAQTPVLVDERTTDTLPVPREPSLRPRATLVFPVTFLLAAGCASSPTPVTDQQKHGAADTAYAAEQAECARTAPSKAASQACRAEKRAAWDAGVEAGR